MKKKTGVTIIGVFVALLLIAAVLGVALVRKYTPNKEYVAGEEHAPVAEGEAHVIFWQEKYEKNALLLNGGIYLDLETVLSYINEDFYYDEEYQRGSDFPELNSQQFALVQAVIVEVGSEADPFY